MTDKYFGYRFQFEDYHSDQNDQLLTLINDQLNDCFTEGTWNLCFEEDSIDIEGPFNQSSHIDIILCGDMSIIDPRNSRIDFSGYDNTTSSMSNGTMFDNISNNNQNMEIDEICQDIEQINLNKNDTQNYLKYYTSDKMYFR